MPLDSWKPHELQNGNSIILKAKLIKLPQLSTKNKLEDLLTRHCILNHSINHYRKMDALFEDLVDRLRTSGRLADSTLLEIVHSAMLDAHKKTVSEEKRGLVRLHHNARFHELSIMELECCLKVVRKEAENNFSDQRYEFEQALTSISEQQALMQKKLEELEIIIAEKDRELTRIKENEVKLAFDVIANEVEKAAKENVKNNSTNQSMVPNVDRESNIGMFDELKCSIEQKVSKIEVKLKNERHILTDKFNKLKQDGVTGLENDGVKQFHGLYNIAHLLIGFEEMISDVCILEENIKFSFKMIESSTSLFKTKLEESKLEMDMEREMLNLLMKSYIQEAQCNNCKLGSIRVTTAAKTTKLQSSKETLVLEEAAALREEIEKVVVSSMINEWNNKKNIFDIEYSMREEIEYVLFGEIMKDLTKFCSSSSTLALSKERDHKAVVSLMINDWNASKEAFQIEYSLREGIYCFVISEIMKDFIKFNSSTSTACRNTENSVHEVKKEVLRDTNTAFTKLSESISDVETMISCITDANNKRLKNLDQQLDVMKEEIILLKRKELLYRNAFLRRCYDLQTAEVEVDLLGDELDFLLGLIKKSYEVLDHHLPEQQYHSEVAEIVNLLKNEVETELQQ